MINLQTGLVFVLAIIAILALCQAGLYKGERRMLERLDQTLKRARVIEGDVTTRTTMSKRSERMHHHRQAAARLNTMQDVELQTVNEGHEMASGSLRIAKPPTPTRTYSLRFVQARPSLANMKRKMSTAFGVGPLIDLDGEASAPDPVKTSGTPEQWMKPEEEGDWV